MGITKSERFTILTFPHEEFEAFKSAILAVANLDELREFIGKHYCDFIDDFADEIEKEDIAARGPRFTTIARQRTEA